MSDKYIPDMFILLAGQSNAVGNTSGLPPTRPELLGDIDNAMVWKGAFYGPLNYPNTNLGSLFGSEMSLAYNYTTNINKTLYIDKTAFGSTAIAQEVGFNDWNVNSNEHIVDLRASLTRLKNKAIELGVSSPKFVLVWIQGAKDANLATGNIYEANFNDILTDINAIQQLDYVIMNITNTDAYLNISGDILEADVLVLRDAQIALSSQGYIENLDLDAFEYNLADPIHYTPNGYQNIGDAVWNMIKLKFNL